MCVFNEFYMNAGKQSMNQGVRSSPSSELSQIERNFNFKNVIFRIGALWRIWFVRFPSKWVKYCEFSPESMAS